MHTAPPTMRQPLLRILLVICQLTLCLMPLATAQATQEARTSSWRAQWIGLPLEGERSPPNQWICYRKQFTLESVPQRALARVAVDSRYWMWINGKLAVYEGGLKRGPTPQDTYYDEVDLAQHLVAGENTVAVLLWHFGKHGFSHHSSERAALCFELEGTELISDASWRALLHPAYGHPKPHKPRPNYRLPETDVLFDARKQLGDWTGIGFEDAHWPQAVELGRPPSAPWNELVRRTTPQLRNLGLRDYIGGRVEPLEGGGQLIKCRLPVNTTIHPWLRVRSQAGLSIHIRTDNYEGGGDRNLRHQYVTRDGVQEYECLGYLNGEEVHYELPAGVEWLALKYRETRYDSDIIGSFVCDDPFYMALRQKALDTLPLNMRDCIQDPDRERAQWWGDVVNVIPQLFVTFDERAHLLVAKAIRNLIDWQRADGSLYSPVPGSWTRELPLQMLASVGEFGIPRYALYSGDLQLVHEVFDRYNRYIDLWALDEQGLVVQRPGEWTWVDWGDNKDEPLLYDGWYHLALRGAEQMATWMDDAERAAELRALQERHAAAFRLAYWTGAEFRSPQHEGPADDRGNALAVLAGLSDPEDATRLEELLQRERHASPYMERFVLEALFALGDGHSALKRMRERFMPMVKNPATTLWERWDLNPKRSSYNHAWSGAALHLLSERVAGVFPLEPGYKRFEVHPRLGPLNSVRATIATIAGPITVHIERRAARIELELNVPPGCTALVELPPSMGEPWTRIFVNGQPCWLHTEDKTNAPPTIELDAGHHELRGEH